MDVKHCLDEPGNHSVSDDDFFLMDKSPNLNISEYVYNLCSLFLNSW